MKATRRGLRAVGRDQAFPRPGWHLASAPSGEGAPKGRMRAPAKPRGTGLQEASPVLSSQPPFPIGEGLNIHA